MGKLYTALSFTGLKLGFITERQLESGLIPAAPVFFIPNISYLSQTALAALRRYQGRLLFLGEETLLEHDEFGRACSSNLSAEQIQFHHGSTSARELHTQLMGHFPAWNLHPAVELRSPHGQPAWGVEWRCAETRTGCVINLCNYLKKPTTVTLLQDGQLVSGRDVLSDEQIDVPLQLAPLEVRLLHLKPARE